MPSITDNKGDSMSTQSKPNGDDDTNVSTLTNEEMQAKLDALTSERDDALSSKSRILEESKNFKEKYQEFKAKEEAQARAKTKADEDRLAEKGEYKLLLEQRDAQLNESKQELADLQAELITSKESVSNLKKAGALEKALGGKLKNSKYWSHVDFGKIAINPDTGAIDEASLTQVASDFKENFKELIDFNKGGKMPNGSGTSSGALTYEQWQALPLAERQSRMKDVKL